MEEQKHVSFEGVDEQMELTEEDQKELLTFDTLNNKDIEFDKVKLADVLI